MNLPVSLPALRMVGGVSLIALGSLLAALGASHDDAWAVISLGAFVIDPRRLIPGASPAAAKDLSMTDTLTSGATAADTLAAGAGNDLIVASAGADVVAAPTPAAPAVNPAKVVASVVQTVTTHPDVHPSAAPGIIASILGGLLQAEPAIFAVSRASSKTQTEVNLGLGLAELILGAFLHPAA